MYDDRGLDLVANDQDTLRGIYRKFNSWVLDYDRKRMESIFGQ
jgi:hypothetical protein